MQHRMQPLQPVSIKRVMHTFDFEKGFDSVHREGLWRFMKRISMVKIVYDDFECSALEEGEQTRWFKIAIGVKQGCVMSGFLFLLTVDWIMRRSTKIHRNGIRWDFTTCRRSGTHGTLVGIQNSNYLRPWYDQFFCMDVKHGN